MVLFLYFGGRYGEVVGQGGKATFWAISSEKIQGVVNIFAYGNLPKTSHLTTPSSWRPPGAERSDSPVRGCSGKKYGCGVTMGGA